MLVLLFTAKKFEDLVSPSPETEKKLEQLYQIRHRERAILSEAATSEASFSSEHTPSMSSGKGYLLYLGQ